MCFSSIGDSFAQARKYEKHAKTNGFQLLFTHRLFCERVDQLERRSSAEALKSIGSGRQVEHILASQRPSWTSKAHLGAQLGARTAELGLRTVQLGSNRRPRGRQRRPRGRQRRLDRAKWRTGGPTWPSWRKTGLPGSQERGASRQNIRIDNIRYGT